MKNKDSYKTIFKSTFLFGFVQVFNIIAKVGINKAVAVFLGVEGVGVIGLYQSTINILKTGFDLGLSQSVVRDISLATNSNQSQFSRIISITKRLIIATSIIGAVATFCLSPLLSRWTFGNDQYTYPFMWISLVVFLNVISEGQLAILKGARMLKTLAKASVYGSAMGLIVCVPLYYFFKEQGIIPSLIVVALISTIFSWYYVNKIDYQRDKVSFKTAFGEGYTMIKMGVALMYVNFLGVVSDYVIRSYINHSSNFEMVGLFQAGSMIISSYFGIIVVALVTDYYPRISAINGDNIKISEEFNRQVEVGLLLISPLIIFFLFAMPFFIKILYTTEFLPIIDFLQYAVFGVLIVMCSNALGFILLAKQASKVFFFTTTLGRIITVSVSIVCFNYWGLTGLGIAAIITAISHLLIVQTVIWKLYKIKMQHKVIYSLLIMLIFALCAFLAKDIESLLPKYSIGATLLLMSIWYTVRKMKKDMNIDIIKLIRNKLHI